jgi:glycolate oxidase iron-sulfur subunit
LAQVLKTSRLSDQAVARRVSEVVEAAARCVQCGLCNAACPTYLLEGDERDGPRGRITMIQRMFAHGQAPTEEVRRHVDRCISCLACVTACPAGVDYGAIIGPAKAYIRETTMPPLRERLLSWFASSIVPFPNRLRWLMQAAPLAARVGGTLKWGRLRKFADLVDAAPVVSASRAAFSGPGTATTTRACRGRVILLAGCAQQVLRPSINDATIRLLARNGIDVEVAAGAGCCGASTEQTGDLERAREFARANIDAWTKSIGKSPADAIVFNTAGCGTAVKDYPRLLRDDSAYAGPAAEIARYARDVCEYLASSGLGPPRRWSSLKIAYQASCRLRHGQGVLKQPIELIHDAGFTVVEMPEGDICCGAGGAYAYREQAMAEALRDRKVEHILSLRPDVIATGSIACLKHMESSTGTPIVHTIELLDWAHGGPVPRGLEALTGEITDVPGPPPLNVEDYIRA